MFILRFYHISYNRHKKYLLQNKKEISFLDTGKAVTPNKSQPYYVKIFLPNPIHTPIHFQFINSDCIIGSLSRFSMVAPSCTQNFFAL